MCFATLSMSQLVHAFNMRSEESIFTINLLGNWYLIGALIIGVIMQVSVIMIPNLSKIFKVSALSQGAWLVVGILCIMPIVIVELQKLANTVFIPKNYSIPTRQQS
jgi:Ca2+-transporting ATPase